MIFLISVHINSLPILFQDLILSRKNYASNKNNYYEIHEKLLFDGHKVISLMLGYYFSVSYRLSTKFLIQFRSLGTFPSSRNCMSCLVLSTFNELYGVLKADGGVKWIRYDRNVMYDITIVKTRPDEQFV